MAGKTLRFRTLQDRLPKELALAGKSDMEQANRFLKEMYLPAFKKRFMVTPLSSVEIFVPLLSTELDDILCLKSERKVINDNSVSYKARKLQIPKIEGRAHYVKTKVMVHEYQDGRVSVFHGPRKLAEYPAIEKKEVLK